MRRRNSRAEEGRIWWGGQSRVWTPVGPQGAGRIEPLRGEHARPLFFERAWWGEFVRTFFFFWNDLSQSRLWNDLSQRSFLERFVPKVAFGTICPGGLGATNRPKMNQKPSKSVKNRSKKHFGDQGASRRRFFSVVLVSKEPLKGVLERLGAIFGRLGGILAPSCGHVGTSGGVLGGSWGCFGGILGGFLNVMDELFETSCFSRTLAQFFEF